MQQVPNHAHGGLALPVALAPHQPDDPSLPVDQHGIRMPPDAEQPRARALPIEQQWESNPELPGELPDGFGVFAQIDSHDFEPPSREPFAERRLCGSLPQALRSGGAEKAKEDDLALEFFGKPHDLSVYSGQGERYAGLDFEKPLGAQRLERISGAVTGGDGPQRHDHASASDASPRLIVSSPS